MCVYHFVPCIVCQQKYRLLCVMKWNFLNGRPVLEFGKQVLTAGVSATQTHDSLGEARGPSSNAGVGWQ